MIVHQTAFAVNNEATNSTHRLWNLHWESEPSSVSWI